MAAGKVGTQTPLTLSRQEFPVKTLESYLCGTWHAADSGFIPLCDPSTEEHIAQVSSRGANFAAALEYARKEGGPALRRLSFVERGIIG